jgi:serine/threonine-protein kinase
MSELPKTIGKYRIRSELGEGAMGVVYEGFDPDIERRVAIKILHPHLISDRNGDEFLERFKREARSAARCLHPNIVTVLEYGQDADTPYIVMEFVEGVTLHDVIGARRGIPLQKTLSIISQLLKALHAAHQLEIVHRDIKAANVMILRDGGNVKLADFGIARIAESAELTKTGAIVGTPKYMAPEQMFGLKVDARADLFSVAMVFLDLLALLPKNPAIPRSSLPEIANLPPNNRIDYTILYPTALVPVLQKGLAATQAERYQSAREFVQGIKAVLPRLKTSASTAGDDATAVVQKSTQSPPTNPGDLDSMTNLLVDYVGPIAKNIMVAHDHANMPAAELASAISREIPQAAEREEFLRRWEVISGTRVDSTQYGSYTTHTSTNPPRSFNDDILSKIIADYTGYIGPLATRLVQHHAASTTDFEHLVELLANEIPDPADRQSFKNRWSRS